MSENTPNSIHCQACGRLIGKYQQVGDQVHLKIGNVVLYKAHGSCVCGAEFHFLSSDQTFQHLIDRIQKSADQTVDLAPKIIYNPIN